MMCPLSVQGMMPLLYLENSGRFKAESMYTNAMQMLEQFKVQQNEGMLLKKQPHPVTTSASVLRWLTPSLDQIEAFACIISACLLTDMVHWYLLIKC